MRKSVAQYLIDAIEYVTGWSSMSVSARALRLAFGVNELRAAVLNMLNVLRARPSR